MNNFPTITQLNSQIQSHSNQFLKWSEVAVDIWYKIDSIREIDTKNGTAQILTLPDKDNNTFESFSTSLIDKQINHITDNEIGTSHLYIRSTGKAEGKRYYGFTISKMN